jgi:hypothetical protein
MGKSKPIVCTFCLGFFDKKGVWWVDMLMHRNDPNCTAKYSVPSCGPCKEDPENSWMIVGISREPQPLKEKKGKKEE